MSDSHKKTQAIVHQPHGQSDPRPLQRRRSDSGLQVIRIAPEGKIARVFGKAHDWMERIEGVSMIEKIARRAQGTLDREGRIFEKLTTTVAQSEPTSLGQACALYFKSLHRAEKVMVFLKRGDGSYRGLLEVTRPNQGQEPVIAALREDLDIATNPLIRIAIEEQRVDLYSDRYRYSIFQSDSAARVARKRIRDLADGFENMMIAPIGDLGVLVANGPDLGVPLGGGLLFPYHAATRMTSLFSKVLHLDQKAKRESLTGLITRDEFRKTMMFLADQYVAYREDSHQAYEKRQDCAIIAVDVDRFRDFNTNHGHAAGDNVLMMVSRKAQGAVRFNDVVSGGAARSSSGSRDVVTAANSAARIGGEEMTVIADGSDAKGGAIVAERFRKAVESGTVLGSDGRPLPQVTASAGVASFSQAEWALRTGYASARGKDGELEGISYQDMTRKQKAEAVIEIVTLLADRALYQAKNNGRNCVFYVVTSEKTGINSLDYERFMG